MSSVGFATLEVIPSMKGLRAKLEQQTKGDFTSAGRRGGAAFGDAAGSEAGGRVKGFLKDAFAPAAGLLAGAGALDLFKGAITGASDLAESGNKIQQIFGDATGEVNKFASQGAKALGQTRLDVLNAAGSFGTFGKAAGLSGKELAGFSTRLAGLSTDLASFFNTDPAQAAEAIAAGLRGESEPLRQFGVLLDDATLRQEAMRQGLVKTTKQALTPQQKVLAAYQVILKQTKDAQGDFARTSGGLANQQRTLSAQWKEMQTQLGSHLLPTVTAFVGALNEGIPAAGKAGSALGTIPGPVKKAVLAFAAYKLAALAVTAANTKLTASFARLRAGAAFSAAGFARTAGSIALLIGAFKALDALSPDDKAVGRYVEKVEALAGPDIADQIKATSAEIKKQQKIIDDAFGPTFHVFGSTVTPFEFGSEWKVADEKVRQLKEQLANLKQQQDLNGIANKKAAENIHTYSNRLVDAKRAVVDLMNKENQRRRNNSTAERSALDLAQSLADARKEAKEGARTLDLSTQAGRDNRQALLDLADQWTNSATRVRTAKGAFESFRQQFIKIAEGMGASKSEARQLAEQLLNVPKNTAATVTTPGMDRALARVKALNEELRRARLGAKVSIQAQGANQRGELADRRNESLTPIGPRSTTHSETFNFNGPIVTPNADLLLAQARNRARRAAADGVNR